MSHLERPTNEDARHRALGRAGVLDTQPEAAFDDLTRLAAVLCGTPVALVSLIDRHRLWFKSRFGLNVTELPRAGSFCDSAITQRELFEVPDAAADERFAACPLVTTDPHARFYAGVPLVTTDGHPVGTLCVLDRAPRTLTDGQKESLRALARQVGVLTHARAQAAERDQLADQLRASEERFGAIFEGTSAGISLTDADGRFVACNRAFAATVGRPVGEVLGRTPADFTHPDDWVAQRHQFDGARAGGPERYTVTKRYVRPDGTQVWTELSFAAVHAADGRYQYGLGVTVDVTERRQAAETFRVLFEQSSDAHLVFDERDGIIDCNPAAVRMLHCRDKSEVLTLHPAVLSPEFQPDGRRSLEKCVEMDATARRNGHHRFDWTHRRADGEEFPCEVTLTPVELHGRSVLLVVWHDLTERKRAEDAVRRSESLFRLVWDSTTEGMRLTDADGRVVAANPSYGVLIGRPNGEAIGRPLTDAYAAADREAGLEKYRDRFADRSARRQTESEVELWDGRRRWFEVGDTYLDLPGQPPLMLTVFRDVTDRKRAEDAVRHQAAVLGSLIEAGPDGILVVDPTARILSYNRRFTQVWGIPDELVAAGDDARVLATAVARTADPDGFRARVVDIYARPDVVATDEVPLADGRVLERYTSPVRGADGRHHGRVWYFRDVTAERRAQHALRESEMRFRTVVDQATDAMILHDAAGRVVDVNRRACESLGYARAELLGMNLRWYDPFLTPSETAGVRAELAAGRTARYESSHLRKDGAVVPVEVLTGRIELNGRPHQLSIARDITERKRAEAALRESEEQYRAAMEGSLDAVFFLVAERGAGGAITDFRFADVNRRGAALVSRAREDVIGRRLCEMLPVNRTAGFFDKYVRVVETGEPLEEEFAVAAGAVSAAWLHHQVVKVGDGVAITSRDITDRKRAEAAVRESEERFDLAVRGSEDGIWDWDLRTGRVYFSPQWKAMLGYADDEVAGHVDEWRRLTHPDDLVRAEAALGAYFARTALQYGLEIRMRHKDGSYRWILARGMAQWAADGTPARMAGSHTDVTERKRAEADLRASEERYRGTVEGLAEGVVLLDLETRAVVRANGAFFDLLGYTAVEMTTLTQYDFVAHDRADIDRHVAEAVRTGQLRAGALQYRRKDGGLVDVSVSASVVPGDGRPLLSVVVRDVSDQLRYERQLLAYQTELEHANAKLLQLATTDGLTGVRNRATFDQALAAEFPRAVRSGSPLSLVMLDVDHFKAFNDTFGHQAGDSVLKRVAAALTAAARGSDMVARYGGEEFAVLLPDTDYEGALVVAERFRRTIASASWDGRPITISVGVSTLTDDTGDEKGLVEEADQALYRSKREGRNRVSHGSQRVPVGATRR